MIKSKSNILRRKGKKHFWSVPQIGLLQANKNPDVYDCSSSSSVTVL